MEQPYHSGSILLSLAPFLFQIYRSKSITGEVRGLKDVVLENTSSTMDFLGEALTDCEKHMQFGAGFKELQYSI